MDKNLKKAQKIALIVFGVLASFAIIFLLMGISATKETKELSKQMDAEKEISLNKKASQALDDYNKANREYHGMDTSSVDKYRRDQELQFYKTIPTEDINKYKSLYDESAYLGASVVKADYVEFLDMGNKRAKVMGTVVSYVVAHNGKMQVNLAMFNIGKQNFRFDNSEISLEKGNRAYKLENQLDKELIVGNGTTDVSLYFDLEGDSVGDLSGYTLRLKGNIEGNDTIYYADLHTSESNDYGYKDEE